jgi:hypothetical protein
MNSCPDAKEWLFHMLETTSHDDFIKIFLTLWAIWSARQKAIHESNFQSLVSIHGFIMSLIADLQVAKDKPSRTRPMVQLSVLRWIPPLEGSAKLNIDGQICRDGAGKYHRSLARVLNNFVDPATLEALACYEALLLVEDPNYKSWLLHVTHQRL